MEFAVKTAQGLKVERIAVLQKPVRPCPVVVYLHCSGGSLMTTGKSLRQLAELGLAAVCFEYDQTNQAGFDEQFQAVLKYVQQQPWAITNSTAWAGASLGGQRILSFITTHPQIQPQLLVSLYGGWFNVSDDQSSTTISQKSAIRCPVFLVYGDRDEIFTREDAARLKDFLRQGKASITEKVLADQVHTFNVTHYMVGRLIAEYCRSVLQPNQPFNGLPKCRTLPFFLYMLTALLWATLCLYLWRKEKREPSPTAQLTGWEIGLRVLAAVLGIWAAIETGVHLITPRLATSERTLFIARRWLIAPKWIADFDCLSTNAVWQGKPLKLLLDHVELAHYNRNELINWKVDEQIYRQFVLSPDIDGAADKELNWHRPLWESFYPRIRKENSPGSAAQIVVRYLRERVTINPKLGYTPGIETAWDRGITDDKGFEILYVAALRSVGIGARLNSSGKAEYWGDKEWVNAPRPMASSFLSQL